MLQDAELDARVREAQRAVAELIYQAARTAPFSFLTLDIHVEHGRPVRMFPAIKRSERFTGLAGEAASDG